MFIGCPKRKNSPLWTPHSFEKPAARGKLETMLRSCPSVDGVGIKCRGGRGITRERCEGLDRISLDVLALWDTFKVGSRNSNRFHQHNQPKLFHRVHCNQRASGEHCRAEQSKASRTVSRQIASFVGHVPDRVENVFCRRDGRQPS